MIKLIVGLGNPGAQYELNRHNIGFLVLDELQNRNGGSAWKSKFKGEYSDISIEGEKVYLLRPQTFMNLSGESVQPFCQFFKVEPDEVLVIHDELDLDFGFIQFKHAGGLAGHNGLKSMAKCFGRQDFYRLRVGIGRPAHGNVSSWVLSNFSSEQDIELGLVMEKSAAAIGEFFKLGFKKASNQYNKKNLLEF